MIQRIPAIIFLPNSYKEDFLMKAVVEGIFRGYKWKQWQKNGKIKLIESKLKRILDFGRGHCVGSKDQKGYHCRNMYHFGDILYITTPCTYQ